jgi:hypothetical protein
MSDFKERLKVELERVRTDNKRLSSFICSEEYKELDSEHASLLFDQLVCMIELQRILEKRVKVVLE